jgi:CRP-like cAMP-binding protein
MPTDIISYFNQIHHVKDLPSQKALKDLIRFQKFEKNAIIQAPGNSCKTVYFVVDGVARTFYLKDGNDITEHFAFGGSIIVRAESLFTEQPTNKGLQALTKLTLVAINAQDLFILFEKHLEIERLFNKIFIQQYLETIRRVESLQFKSAKERYTELLNETSLINQIPLKFIASYLGITQVSLSRVRGTI